MVQAQALEQCAGARRGGSRADLLHGPSEGAQGLDEVRPGLRDDGAARRSPDGQVPAGRPHVVEALGQLLGEACGPSRRGIRRIPGGDHAVYQGEALCQPVSEGRIKRRRQDDHASRGLPNRQVGKQSLVDRQRRNVECRVREDSASERSTAAQQPAEQPKDREGVMTQDREDCLMDKVRAQERSVEIDDERHRIEAGVDSRNWTGGLRLDVIGKGQRSEQGGHLHECPGSMN
ncbi:hypothetical protein [Methylobacterium frigidaeris]|uniref:hypothetical protein n=1 Tax=Methylobacterium frigidaeris TaxID=2038277 RepID=UPI001FD207CC|nr:hypothetical protein [Methylobacterium frigidaeris]